MGTPTGLTFLDTVAGYAQMIGRAENPSANAAIRLAVIDPAYVPTSYPATLPKVTFEGEDTVGDKRYLVIDRAYFPGPGDRVVMLPVGHTYVIAGIVSPAYVAPHYAQNFGDNTVRSTTSSTYVTLTGSPTATIELRAGQPAEVNLSVLLAIDTSDVNGSVASLRITGPSGTDDLGDDYCIETGHQEWTPGSRTIIWGPASVGGNHTFAIIYKRIGSVGNANSKRGLISARAL